MRRICPATADDYDRIAEMWNTIWPLERVSADEMRRDEVTLPEAHRPSYWLAYAGNQSVGLASVWHPIGVGHDRYWMTFIGVLPEWRRRGFGGELSLTALSYLADNGAEICVARVQEDDPESFLYADRRGFRETKRDFVSVLDLGLVDPRSLEELTRLRAPFQIERGKALDCEAFRRQFHEAFEEVRVDVPREIPPKRIEFEVFDELVTSSPDFLWDGMFVAVTGGQIVGFTGIYRDSEVGRLSQWLTAVRRPWRGNGIAKALKARQIQWAISAGHRLVQTDNDTRNGPMLAVNEQLGFQRQPGMISMRKLLG